MFAGYDKHGDLQKDGHTRHNSSNYKKLHKIGGFLKSKFKSFKIDDYIIKAKLNKFDNQAQSIYERYRLSIRFNYVFNRFMNIMVIITDI